MANSIVEGTSRLVSAGEAAQMLGVTDQTIRNYCRAGELEFVLTLGGHRRIALASVRRWMGEDDEPNDERGTAIYSRVSTNRQRQEGNLSRQVDRLVDYCQDEFGISRENLLIIDETGSGLNENRKGYLRLVDLILSRNISRVVIEGNYSPAIGMD